MHIYIYNIYIYIYIYLKPSWRAIPFWAQAGSSYQHLSTRTLRVTYTGSTSSALSCRPSRQNRWSFSKRRQKRHRRQVSQESPTLQSRVYTVHYRAFKACGVCRIVSQNPQKSLMEPLLPVIWV